MIARAQAGYLSIVALLLMVVVVSLVIVMGFLFGANTMGAASRAGSMQAFFLAEAGLEHEQRRWAQNLEWYRSAVDPIPVAPVAQALGSGTFTVSATIPATLVRTRLVAGGATLNVYTTNRFPAAGILQIGDDIVSGAEFVRYAGVAGASFTGLARAQTVGTVASVAAAHARSSPVYPVTILRTALAASCAPLASLQIDAHGKFLGAGTIAIEGEEIRYAGSSTLGGTTTLTGITRCVGTVGPVAHAIGQPVTPVLGNGDSAIAQVEIASTGTSGPNIRYARRTVER